MTHAGRRRVFGVMLLIAAAGCGDSDEDRNRDRSISGPGIIVDCSSPLVACNPTFNTPTAQTTGTPGPGVVDP